MLITVNDIPKSNNAYIGRNARWQYQADKKRWEQLITAAIDEKPENPIEQALVVIQYTFPTRRRHDPDNYSGKMLLDPLVRNGILVDDDFTHVVLELKAKYQKGIKKTEIVIHDMQARNL